ncbi:hypothetical protein LLH00_07840 [bacterium]|nr:hypothetical protein [bacterium]
MRWSYLVVALLTLLVLGWAMRMGGEIMMAVDLPSLALVLAPALLMSLATHGPAEMAGCFAVAFKKEGVEPAALEKGILFFKTLQAYFTISAVISFLMGLIILLASAEDYATICPGLAVSIISVLYAYLLALLVTVPFRTALEKKKIELGR